MAKQSSTRLGASTFVLMSAVTTALLVALALLAARFVFLEPSQMANRQALVSSQLQAARQGVERQFERLIRSADGLAMTLSRQSKESWGGGQENWLEKMKPALPSLRRVVIFPLGNVARDNHEELPVSFAAVDMLRRAEQGGHVVPEAFLGPDRRWFLQYAAPLKDAEHGITGTVLVMVDGEMLDKVFPSSGGRFTLAQVVNGEASTVREQGEGVYPQQTLILANEAWQVGFEAAHAKGRQPAWLFWTVLGALSLLSGLLAALIASWLGAKAKADIAALTAFSSQLFTGGQEPSVRAFFPLTRQGMEMLLQEKRRQPASSAAIPTPNANLTTPRTESESSAPSSAVVEAKVSKADSSEPLFDNDDALELLDEGGDVLGLGVTESAQGMEIEESEGVEVPASLFRAYDIRGTVNKDLRPEVVREIGKAIGSEALQAGHNRCCVGRDGRLSSPELAAALCDGLVSTGLDVVDLGMVPTPVLYFAVGHLQTGAGVMVTGSHNPPEYNGLKVLINGHALVDEQIQALYQRTRTRHYENGAGKVERQSVEQSYIDTIVADIAVAAPLRVVVDAGHGAASDLGPRLLEELGCEVIPINCEVDGNFPSHHPDPGNPENLKQLIEEVRSQEADVGIAFDGDGDRLGVVTDTGRIIWPDRLLMLFAKDVVSRNPGADVIYDVKCTRNLNGLISRYGGRPIMWRSGHSVMKAKMRETGALLGGEISGHIFFKERWFGFDDGIYSAARLLEILGIEEGSVEAVFSEFPDEPATPELQALVKESEQFAIVEHLQASGDWPGATVSNLDGVRAEFEDGWGLCRASNTTPTLTFRFEGGSEEALVRIQAIFRERLLKIKPDLDLPF